MVQRSPSFLSLSPSFPLSPQPARTPEECGGDASAVRATAAANTDDETDLTGFLFIYFPPLKPVAGRAVLRQALDDFSAAVPSALILVNARAMKIVFSLTFYQSARLNVDGEEEFWVSEGVTLSEFVSGTGAF